MLASQVVVRTPAFLLHRDCLRSLLHDRVCVLDVVLAGPQGGAGKGGLGGDHALGHVHHPSQYPELSSTRCLHQGHRCMVGSLCLLCVWSLAGVCNGQLCIQVSFTIEQSSNIEQQTEKISSALSKTRCYLQVLYCCRQEARNCLHCCCTFL